MSMKRILKKHHLKNEISEAVNGQQAIDLLEKLTEKDLLDNSYIIFMDINMPLMDGFECLDAIKSNENYSHIPY